MAGAKASAHTGPMNAHAALATPWVLRVLIATQSPHTGSALASLLGEPSEISYEVVRLSGVLPLDIFRAQAHGVDVVLLDLEPWPVKALHTASSTKTQALPLLLVLALAHSVEESMRRQCRDAGIDHLMDRTADLGRLHSMISDYAQRRRSDVMLLRAAL